MRFTPKSDTELSNLLPDGVYDFCIKHAEDAISKSGNEMIKATISLYDSHGREHTLTDYLLEAMPRKLKHFSYAVGLQKEYEQGSLNANDCINKTGRLELSIEIGGRNPSGGFYPNKNSIVDYMLDNEPVEVVSTIKTSSTNKKDHPILDDDVPF